MLIRRSQMLVPPSGDRLLELTHIFGILCLISSPFWATGLLFPSSGYGPGMAFATFPAIIALALFIISRVAKRDQFLREVMLVGFAIRLLSTALFFQLFFRVWHGAADLMGYFYGAGGIYNEFYKTDRISLVLPFQAQNVVVDVAGFVAILTGWSLPGLCLMFSLFAFLGQVLFFKAFCLAFPKIKTRMPAMVFFMLPSMLFWTSFLSKDSLIFLLIAISFYGLIRMQTSGVWWAPMVGFGLIGASFIRSHIGGMLAIAYMAAFLITTNRKGYLVMVAKMAAGPLLLAGTLYLVTNAQHLVGAENVNESVDRLQTLHKGLETGGSSTGGASLATGLALAPVLPFRPLPWEVHNPQMAVSCVEGCFLFAALWNRRRGIIAAYRKIRTSPGLVAATIFCVQFMLVFSIGMGNVGTLVRERAMMLPFWFFIVYSVEPAKRLAQTYPAVRRLRALREMSMNSQAV